MVCWGWGFEGVGWGVDMNSKFGRATAKAKEEREDAEVNATDAARAGSQFDVKDEVTEIPASWAVLILVRVPRRFS